MNGQPRLWGFGALGCFALQLHCFGALRLGALVLYGFRALGLVGFLVLGALKLWGFWSLRLFMALGALGCFALLLHCFRALRRGALTLYGFGALGLVGFLVLVALKLCGFGSLLFFLFCFGCFGLFCSTALLL